jgi:hypothetical protein
MALLFIIMLVMMEFAYYLRGRRFDDCLIPILFIGLMIAVHFGYEKRA